MGLEQHDHPSTASLTAASTVSVNAVGDLRMHGVREIDIARRLMLAGDL